MTVAPTASGFSRPIFSFSCMKNDLISLQHMASFDTHLVLRIQSLVPPFFHFLPIVFHIDSEYIEILASSELHNFLKMPG